MKKLRIVDQPPTESLRAANAIVAVNGDLAALQTGADAPDKHAQIPATPDSDQAGQTDSSQPKINRSRTGKARQSHNAPQSAAATSFSTQVQGILRMIPWRNINADARFQVREAIDDDAIEDYAADIKAGQKLPPIVVFDCDGVYILADGFHRFWATRDIHGYDCEIEAEVHQGSQADACRYGIQANLRHGVRVTSADKRRFAKLSLEHWPLWSNSKIAQLCGCSHPTVAKVRAEIQPENFTSSEPRLGRDGKRRRKSKKNVTSEDPLEHESVDDVRTQPMANDGGEESPETTNPGRTESEPEENTTGGGVAEADVNPAALLADRNPNEPAADKPNTKSTSKAKSESKLLALVQKASPETRGKLVELLFTLEVVVPSKTALQASSQSWFKNLVT